MSSIQSLSRTAGTRKTVEILDKVETDPSKYEQCLAALYRRISSKVKPPLPTTLAVVH